MFKKLTDFEYKRNPTEAVGFYIAYLLMVMLVGGVAGGLFASDFSTGLQVGSYSAIVMHLILSGLLLHGKNRYKSLINIALALVAILLSSLGGGLFGLIPLAYLSTRK